MAITGLSSLPRLRLHYLSSSSTSSPTATCSTFTKRRALVLGTGLVAVPSLLNSKLFLFDYSAIALQQNRDDELQQEEDRIVNIFQVLSFFSSVIVDIVSALQFAWLILVAGFML